MNTNDTNTNTTANTDTTPAPAPQPILTDCGIGDKRDWLFSRTGVMALLRELNFRAELTDIYLSPRAVYWLDYAPEISIVAVSRDKYSRCDYRTLRVKVGGEVLDLSSSSAARLMATYGHLPTAALNGIIVTHFRNRLLNWFARPQTQQALESRRTAQREAAARREAAGKFEAAMKVGLEEMGFADVLQRPGNYLTYTATRPGTGQLRFTITLEGSPAVILEKLAATRKALMEVKDQFASQSND